MFTGLVETMGTVVAATGSTPRRLTIQSPLPHGEVRLGDSVAVDGCCLTVVAADATGLAFEAATETLARTTLGGLAVGARVNLERALRLGDRLGGHLVAGHVDGVGTVRERAQRGSALYVGIEAPREVGRLTAPRGSITVAGVSLTVTEVRDMTFWVGLIPHTLGATTLGALQVGDRVNLEADLLARYLERLLHVEGAAALTGGAPPFKEAP
jgi:riboflavin synthase